MDINLDDLKLNERQATFAKEYAVSGNGTKSAIAAKYSPNGAAVAASKLLKHPKVAAAIDRIKQAIVLKATEQERIRETVQQGVQQGVELLETRALTAEDVKCALGRIKVANELLAKFVTQENGHLRFDFSGATQEALEAICPAIGEIKTVSVTSKDGRVTTTTTFKRLDPVRVLAQIGLHKDIGAWIQPEVNRTEIYLNMTPEQRRDAARNLLLSGLTRSQQLPA